MINKLLLIRTQDIDSSLTERSGAATFVKGEPIPISPKAWNEEAGLSHYGFVLEGMKLKNLKELETWIKDNGSEGVQLHEYSPDTGVDKALASIGLKINKSA